MNASLKSVDWPQTFRDLFESLDDLPGWDAGFYTRPHGLLSRVHVLLAVVAVQAGRDRCNASPAGSKVGGWLYDGARTAHRMLTLDPEPQWACPTFTGYLRVDPRLPVQPLPLLGLAAEHAEAVRRPLIIGPGERLGPTTAGRTWRNTTADIGDETRTVDVVELHARDAATAR